MLKFKRLHTLAIAPTKGTKDSACFDLYAIEDVHFLPGEIKLVKTGWAVQPPKGHRLNIYVRSSTPIKKQFILANSVGVIDSDYRGELMIQLMNVKNQPVITPKGYELDWSINKISRGDKIAQIEVVSNYEFDVKFVNELDYTDRGSGGFGSTGD